MNPEELARVIRKGDAELRVNRVVVTAGTTKFRGSGVLRIQRERFNLDLKLSGKSKPPKDKKSVWQERDYWNLRGVIEPALTFTATHVAPSVPAWSDEIITLQFSVLEVPRRSTDLKQHAEARRMLGEFTAKDAAAKAGHEQRKRKAVRSRFTAELINSKLLANNEMTHTVRQNAFLGKTRSWETDTFIAKGPDFDVALIQRDDDLHVHFRSKARYKTANAGEDYRYFQAVLDAISFTHGFNAWPWRVQQWRDGFLVKERFTALKVLPKTAHAPFDRILGHRGCPPPIHLAARFFFRKPKLASEITSLLFIFRQAGEDAVHLPVGTLAFCSLFEGLIKLLFDEMELEGALRASNSEFDKFLNTRDRLIKELVAKGRGGDAASKRLASVLSGAGAVRVKDKFNALCNAFGLDIVTMKPHFDAWYAERNSMMHGTWRDRETDFEHQALIAGAINILLLKLIGYSGEMVAVRFGRPFEQTYRTI